MKGDFSRITYRPERHYSGVLLQQGRVSLDADFNEHAEIERARTRTLARDVIGPCGGPRDGAGFNVRVADDGALVVGAGRYYVDGMLIENERDAPVTVGGLSPGPYLVYLDAWEREVTAVDDPQLRDPALGGPDTSLRIQVVWQVRLMPAGSGSPPLRPRPWLDVRTGERGYVGTENQLYRVEVHSGDAQGNVSFKWSRDNASLVLPIIATAGDQLTLGADGRRPDGFDRLESGQWLELTDGQLVQIIAVGLDEPVVTVSAPVGPLTEAEQARQWHGVFDRPQTGDQWFALENGIEVQVGGEGFTPGDYWVCPARTATGKVEWPGTAQPAGRIEHNYCPLALLKLSKKGLWRVVSDRRLLFAPLAIRDHTVG
jgi:Family of unknown function (DUF6519)